MWKLVKDLKYSINIHNTHTLTQYTHTNTRAHKRPNKIQLKSKVLNLSGNSVINKTDYIYKRENILNLGCRKTYTHTERESEFLLLFRLQYRDDDGDDESSGNSSGFCLTPVTSITIIPLPSHTHTTTLRFSKLIWLQLVQTRSNLLYIVYFCRTYTYNKDSRLPVLFHPQKPRSIQRKFISKRHNGK